MRFSIRDMLGVTAVTAVWFSTFAMRDEFSQAGIDIRHACLMLILLWAVAHALYAKGSSRAFWVGFTLVWVLCHPCVLNLPDTRLFEHSLALLAENLSDRTAQDASLWYSVRDTFVLVATLSMSAIGGAIFWIVYRRNREAAG